MWPRDYKTDFFPYLTKAILQRGCWKILATALTVASCYLWVFIPGHNVQHSQESKKIIHDVAWMESSSFSVVLGQIFCNNWGTRAYCVGSASQVISLLSLVSWHMMHTWRNSKLPTQDRAGQIKWEPPLLDRLALLPRPLSRRLGLLA